MYRRKPHTLGSSVALAMVSLLGAACSSSGSSNPLVGTWSSASTTGATTVTETVDIHGDGSLSVTQTAQGASCTGSVTSTGFSWSSTATTVSVTGSASCTGSITCGAISFDCADAAHSLTSGTCTYALSDGNDTFALTGCTGISDATFTRQG
jgi:hypothetical protein